MNDNTKGRIPIQLPDGTFVWVGYDELPNIKRLTEKKNGKH